MARRSALRASDDDREQVAERLRRATVEGRLLAEELEERLGRVFAARTYGELDATVADLPRTAPARRRQVALRPRSVIAAAVLLALMIPVLLAVITAVVFLVTGVLLVWGLWAAVAWWVFGHRILGPRRWHAHRGYGRRRMYGPGPRRVF